MLPLIKYINDIIICDKTMIYFDYSANYPTRKEVLDELVLCENEYYGNTNSMHELGKKSHQKYLECLNKLYSYLNISKDEYEIIFTPSATYANNLAIQGIAKSYSGFGDKILTSEFEHSSTNTTLSYLKDLGKSIEFVKTKQDGQLDLFDLESKITPSTILLCVCLVESEVGTIQDYKKILEITNKYPHLHVLFDVTQGMCKFKFDYSKMEMFTFTPHKFGGLIGTGFLVIRKNTIITPLIYGGKAESNYNPGTFPLSLFVSSVKAIELGFKELENNYSYVLSLYEYLIQELQKLDNITINSQYKNPYICNISIKNKLGSYIVDYLSSKGICVSQKSACSITNTPSKTIMSMYHDRKRALSSFRISLSNLTTLEQVKILINTIKEIK